MNGMIGLSEGSTFEVLNAANGQLLYSYVLPAGTYGAVSVAYGQFFVPTLGGAAARVRRGQRHHPARRPELPDRVHLPGHPRPGQGHRAVLGGTLTVTAAGTGIKGTGDQFRFISQNSDRRRADQRADRLARPAARACCPQAGLMVRQTNAIESPFYGVIYHPNDSPPDLKVEYRSTWGKNPTVLASYPVSTPVTVMIQRQGNLFSAGISTDGINYTLIPGSTADVDLPTTTMQGLAVASGSSTATSRRRSATSASARRSAPRWRRPRPPTRARPAGPAPTSGTRAPPGDTTGSGRTLTLAGTGTGFGGSSDSAHYVYQSVRATSRSAPRSPPPPARRPRHRTG